MPPPRYKESFLRTNVYKRLYPDTNDYLPNNTFSLIQLCIVISKAPLVTAKTNSYTQIRNVMSEHVNKVQLVGRLGNTPEIRTFDSGKKMARFSVATSESYIDSKGVNVVNTQWHNLVAWGRAAAVAEKQLFKGAEVSVEGRLAHRNYMDKDGIKRYVTEVVVAEVLLLSTKENKEESKPFLETV